MRLVAREEDRLRGGGGGDTRRDPSIIPLRVEQTKEAEGQSPESLAAAGRALQRAARLSPACRPSLSNTLIAYG